MDPAAVAAAGNRSLSSVHAGCESIHVRGNHPKLPQAGAGRRRQAHGPPQLVSIGNQAGERCLSSRLGAEEVFVLFLSSRY